MTYKQRDSKTTEHSSTLAAVRTQFLQHPCDTEAVEGSNITMFCELNLTLDSSDEGQPWVDWYRDGYQISIENEDRYNYIDEGITKTLYLRDTVTISSSSNPTGNDVSISQNTNLTLHCNADGYPEPTYAWFHNLNRIRVLGNTLVIEQVALDDRGFYSCQANSAVGKYMSSNMMNVSVAVPAAYASMTVDHFVAHGAVTIISGLHGVMCFTRKSFPGGKVTWRLGDREVKTAITLHIYNDDGTIATYSTLTDIFTSADDGETLTCHVDIHELFQPLSVELQLDVQYMGEVRVSGGDERGNVTLEPGNPLRLLCTANGNPAPYFSWLHNKTLAVGNGSSSYEKESVGFDDTGVYECAARNNAGVFISNEVAVSVIASDSLDIGRIIAYVIFSLFILIALIDVVAICMRKRAKARASTEPEEGTTDDDNSIVIA
ncbi:PREDICTED: hemicentin-1-like [Priapulus caudatus]|uniref:Hemicentin-1-like n=1 Tax=Priapulus caudatus TaxID=37621 RepID=A0ABM1F1X1_PRICU|nr:PREDICTED: hemicentin-1-like [Priapulus caudatus]